MTATEQHSLNKRWLIAGAVGWVLALFTLPLTGLQIFLYSYLAAFIFWLGMPIGCATLILVHRLTGGRWGWQIRQPAQYATLTIPLILLLFIPLALGVWWIYPWAADSTKPANSHAAFRHFYLSPTFFYIRALLYFALWTAGSRLILTSRKRTTSTEHLHNQANTSADIVHQSASDDSHLPLVPRSTAAAAISLILLVLTVTFAGIDWVGSLIEGWYSSILGLYLLSGFALSAICILIVVLHLAAFRSNMPFDPDLAQDMGNLLMMFIILHAYIAFSQYIIIWNGNLPHEVTFYLERGGGFWGIIILLLGLVQLFLPLFALLMRSVKRQMKSLATVAGVVLFTQIVEVAWLILPSLHRSDFTVITTALTSIAVMLAILLGMGGLWMAAYTWFALRYIEPLSPSNSPSRFMQDTTTPPGGDA